MTGPLTPTPDNTRSWLRLALEVLDRATSVTLLLILIIGALASYYFVRELGRTRQINTDLWRQLMASEQGKVELALRCQAREQEKP